MPVETAWSTHVDQKEDGRSDGWNAREEWRETRKRGGLGQIPWTQFEQLELWCDPPPGTAKTKLTLLARNGTVCAAWLSITCWEDDGKIAHNTFPPATILVPSVARLVARL